jgi:hypothetical protein
MEQHVKIVAILNIVAGSLGILIALGVLLLFGGLAGLAGADNDSEGPIGAAVLAMVGGVAFFAIALPSVPSIIAGVGLLKFREWARVLGMVASVLHLFNIPIGTALGVYGLWVLSKDETRDLLKAKSGEMPVAMAR